MRYIMKQDFISWGTDFTIKDEHGDPRYKVDGKVFSFGDKLTFHDTSGRQLARIEQKLLAWGPTYELFDQNDQPIAVVKKKFFTFFTCAFSVDIPGPDDIEAKGNFLDKEYTFYRFGGPIAQVSKKWFSWTDTYGIDILEPNYDVLVLSCAVVIDLCCHNGKN